MRLLQVSAFFPRHGGGIEVVAGELARRLAASGVAVHWVAGGSPGEWPDAARGVTVEGVESFDGFERRLGLPLPLWPPRGLRLLWRRVGECDLVQLHDFLYMPTLAALVFARLRNRPIVLTQHIGEVPYRSRVARWSMKLANRVLGAWALAAADQVVFVGKPVMTYFQRFVRFRRAPVLLSNGVDHDRFAPREAIAAEDLRDEGVRLLYVGRFVEKKGLPLLLQCLTLPGSHWTFVGQGPLAPAPQPRVAVVGRLPPERVADAYRHADLLVLPSTGEGFPLVLQEALACGTPVLVSSEVYDAFPRCDDRCVFHVELRHGDPVDALRRRLRQLLADPAALARARPHAAALAAQWSWQACVDGYAALYERLADERAARCG